MNPDKQRALARQLLKIVGRATPPDVAPPLGGRLIALEGPGFTLDETAGELYDELIRRLLKEKGWSGKFSESAFGDRLNWILTRLVRDPTEGNALRELRALAEEVESYSVERTVYVPLFGITLALPDLQLGKVTLANVTTELEEELLSRVRAAIERGRDDEDNKAAMRSMLEEDIRESFGGKVVATYRVVAEPTRALQRAEEEARRSLELLRFAASFLYSRRSRVRIGLLGEATSTRRLALTISAGEVHGASKWVGGLETFTLDEQAVERLRSLGALELSDLLRTQDRSLTDFEQALLDAVHWFSSAQAQPELENELLNLMTCVESLLTPKGGSPIAAAVSEGVALVIGDSLEGRKLLRGRMTGLYKSRSGVSHGGRKAVLEAECRELELIARTLLARLIPRGRDFESRTELIDAIRDMKLSGPAF